MAEQKTNQAVEEISVTKSDLRTIFWRSFCHEASYNAERQQALGFAFTLTKLLKKLYKDDKEAYVEACKRHTEFFNLTVQITNFVVGIVTALEEKNAKSQDKNMGPTISAVKSALMGPLAGIGDTIDGGVVTPLLLTLFIGITNTGNIMGVIGYIIVEALFMWTIYWQSYKLGYEKGSDAIVTIMESGLINQLMVVRL